MDGLGLGWGPGGVAFTEIGLKRKGVGRCSWIGGLVPRAMAMANPFETTQLIPSALVFPHFTADTYAHAWGGRGRQSEAPPIHGESQTKREKGGFV